MDREINTAVMKLLKNYAKICIIFWHQEIFVDFIFCDSEDEYFY